MRKAWSCGLTSIWFKKLLLEVFSWSSAFRILPLVSTRSPSVSGRSVSRLKYLMVCGRPSSIKVKSSFVRLVTIWPFLSRTVTGSVTTFTFTVKVVEDAEDVAGLPACAKQTGRLTHRAINGTKRQRTCFVWDLIMTAVD